VLLSKSVLVPLNVRVAFLSPLRVNRPLLVSSLRVKVAFASLAWRVWVRVVPSGEVRVSVERISSLQFGSHRSDRSKKLSLGLLFCVSSSAALVINRGFKSTLALFRFGTVSIVVKAGSVQSK